MSVDTKQIQKRFSTKARCIVYLEKLKWKGEVRSPYSGTTNVTKRKGSHLWHCNDTQKDFSVLKDTIFEHSRYPLPDWFFVICLILNAKTGISAMNIMRNLKCSYKTAWLTAMRIRCAMIDHCIELENLVEMDEAYIGGRKRKVPANKPNISTVSSKRGRGTNRTPIVGVVERNGKVVLKVAENLTSKFLLEFLKENVNTEKSIVITDAFPSYRSFDKIVEHLTINHKKEYSRGIVHTSTIEGFWSIIKNSIRGQYIVLSKKYLPLYLVQAQYIYNRKDSKHDLFEEFIKLALGHSPEMLNYKPKKAVKEIVYKLKKEAKC